MVRTKDAIVQFDGVEKSYDGKTLVVKALNLSVARGEFLTMLGPSGSGKTTTLMMLAGFEAPTYGDIYLESKPINHLPPHKRGIGMVFQNYALFPHMTVAENVAFPLQVRKLGRSEIEQRVEKALGMVRLPAYGTRRPSQLSGGQQQRVAVARALVFEPSIVLMDEPLGALDKKLREEMQYEIKHIHESLGVTVVYVTHDQGEALTMSNRIAVFNDGRIQQLDKPTELYEHPRNSFVAQFIGENNRLPGKVLSSGNGRCLVELESGEKVQALAVNVAGPNARTSLSLRPERCTLAFNGKPAGAIDGNGGAPENVFEGRVEELIYLGDHVRARLAVCGRNDFVVKVPNDRGTPDLGPGVTARVAWRADDCRALDPV